MSLESWLLLGILSIVLAIAIRVDEISKPTKRKIDDAKTLKIKIIDQNEWLKMLNKTS